MWRPFLVGLMAVLLVPPAAQAVLVTETLVDAEHNSVSISPGDPAHPPPYVPTLADTGLDLHVGDVLDISATGLWRISPSDPFTDANGQVGRDSSGFNVGSLLGQISADGPHMHIPLHPFPDFFFVGAAYSGVARAGGRLYFGFNDTDFGNNEGSVLAHVEVSPVPEPASLLLLGLGFIMVGTASRFGSCHHARSPYRCNNPSPTHTHGAIPLSDVTT